jgi:hypothetical protein
MFSFFDKENTTSGRAILSRRPAIAVAALLSPWIGSSTVHLHGVYEHRKDTFLSSITTTSIPLPLKQHSCEEEFDSVTQRTSKSFYHGIERRPHSGSSKRDEEKSDRRHHALESDG